LISKLRCFLFVGGRHADAGLQLHFPLGMRPDGDIPVPMIQTNHLTLRQRQTLLEITREVFSIWPVGRQCRGGCQGCTEDHGCYSLFAEMPADATGLPLKP
jgi:hypothetical protein